MSEIKPKYYKAGSLDAISYAHHHRLNFCLGNVLKYITRAGKKDKAKEVEDLEKAMEYLRREIKERRGNG